MRFIIYGAGAIGASVGACLFEHEHDVILIARGAHKDVIASSGLEFSTPDGVRRLPIPVVGSPSEISWDGDDVVFMAMKVQDGFDAIRTLSVVAPPQLPVVCLQNGVEGERMAIRNFENVYGAMIMSPTAFLSPGSVIARSTPNIGVYDVGRYPSGIDDTVLQITHTLNASRMSSAAREDILAWKYTKLLGNIANAVQAVFDTDRRSGGPILDRLTAEAIACYTAAGLKWVSDDEFNARSRESGMQVLPVPGVDDRHVGSTWQSLARGAGSIESDFLNGEIVLLGRLYGIATPANALLQRISNELSARGGHPGRMTEEEFLTQLSN